MGARGDVRAGVADVHPLHGAGVLANDAEVFVGEEVSGPKDAVLPGHDHNVLGNRDHAGDILLGPGILVAMETKLSPVEEVHLTPGGAHKYFCVVAQETEAG